MEVRATGKYVKVQPRKVRIIADEVRGTNAMHTAGLLRYHKSKSAKALRKVLMSAVANSQANVKDGDPLVPVERLKIAGIFVDEGPRMKRMRARAMGRGARILKKTAHITVIVAEAEEQTVSKPKGTRAKPRPTFGGGRRRRARAATSDGMTVMGSAIPAPIETPAPVEVEPEAVEPETTIEETPVEEAEATTTAEETTSDDKGAE